MPWTIVATPSRRRRTPLPSAQMSSRPHDQATANVASGSSTPQSMNSPAQRRQKCSVAELSQALFDFVVQLLPTAEELAVKEDVRKLLERLIRTIEPDSRLLSFGSTANGFSLRNSGKLIIFCDVRTDDINSGFRIRYGSVLHLRHRGTHVCFESCHAGR